MPQFALGEAKRATAPITVRPSGLSCEAEIFLGPDETTKVATSGRIGFTSTGVTQSVRLPITMPAVEGTYHAYIDVYAEGMLIAAYKAIQDVVIVTPEPVTIDSFKVRCDFPKNFIYTKTTITNHTNQTYIDETPSTGLVAELWAAGYIGPDPAKPWWPYDRGLGFIFVPRVSDGRGVGNVPPGTHTYEGVFYGEPTVIGPWFQHLGIVEGTPAWAEIRFRAGDEKPTPMLWFVDIRQMFGGKFSSVWQRWEKTDWRPNLPPGP